MTKLKLIRETNCLSGFLKILNKIKGSKDKSIPSVMILPIYKFQKNFMIEIYRFCLDKEENFLKDQ